MTSSVVSQSIIWVYLKESQEILSRLPVPQLLPASNPVLRQIEMYMHARKVIAAAYCHSLIPEDSSLMGHQ